MEVPGEYAKPGGNVTFVSNPVDEFATFRFTV
jgi:hypothetical protein